jgi:IclR helix-turn-helix domain
MSDERISRTFSRRAMGDREDRGRVFLQLSEEQVDIIIQRAAKAGDSAARGVQDSEPHAPIGDDDPGESTQWIFRPLMEDKSFSHSLLIGLEVLTCFPLDGTERGVADVAEQLNMNNSTVHRYMSTLLRVGLLERNPQTRWYRVASVQPAGGTDH